MAISSTRTKRIEDLKSQTIDAEQVRETPQQFDPTWDVPQFQERIAFVHQVIEKAVYDPENETIHIDLPGGTHLLSGQRSTHSRFSVYTLD